MKLKRFSLALLAALVISLAFSSVFAFASGATDEILDYEITADVNENATVTLTYHIEWKVLVSDGIGPLENVNIGIPNSKVSEIEALSDNIESIDYSSDKDGSYAEIYFEDSYYKGEICSFDFRIVTDYLYSMNDLKDGETVYSFTPGWFTDIAVDSYTIRWNSENAKSWNPSCKNDGGYLTWTGSSSDGSMREYTVTYDNDAFAFDESKEISKGIFSYLPVIIIGLLMFLVIPVFIVWTLVKTVKSFAKGANLKPTTKTKVTRTKIEYYANCPGCGSQRKEGQTTCEYCGHSFVKSEEVIKEDTVEDKEALKYNEKGEYQYSSNPNTYVRVNVVNIPVFTSSPRPTGGRTGRGGSGRSGGSSHHSSCAHSSCACACVSCACACACACAGGGRAGCSAKDFYNTGVKLRSLELRADFSKEKNE